MNPRVSLIIPTYNCEKYIDDFMKSVINQTYSNVEIIIVNDGSTDRTENICRDYAKTDERIKIISKKNGGQASARNRALDICTGEYIAFADSDDILADDYIDTMVGLALENDADLVQGGYIKFWKEYSVSEDGMGVEKYNTSEALKEFCLQKKFVPAPWGKLIKRQTWGEVRFPEDMGYEDYAIMYKVIGRAVNIVYSSKQIYFYRIHNESTQHSIYSDKKKDRLKIADELMEYIGADFPMIYQYAENRYCLAQLQFLMELPFDSKYRQDKREAYSNLLAHRKNVMKNKDIGIKMKVMLVSSLFGPNVLMVLGRAFMFFTRR